jgi:hypothetical protein
VKAAEEEELKYFEMLETFKFFLQQHNSLDNVRGRSIFEQVRESARSAIVSMPRDLLRLNDSY